MKPSLTIEADYSRKTMNSTGLDLPLGTDSVRVSSYPKTDPRVTLKMFRLRTDLSEPLIFQRKCFEILPELIAYTTERL